MMKANLLDGGTIKLDIDKIEVEGTNKDDKMFIIYNGNRFDLDETEESFEEKKNMVDDKPETPKSYYNYLLYLEFKEEYAVDFIDLRYDHGENSTQYDDTVEELLHDLNINHGIIGLGYQSCLQSYYNRIPPGVYIYVQCEYELSSLKLREVEYSKYYNLKMVNTYNHKEQLQNCSSPIFYELAHEQMPEHADEKWVSDGLWTCNYRDGGLVKFLHDEVGRYTDENYIELELPNWLVLDRLDSNPHETIKRNYVGMVESYFKDCLYDNFNSADIYEYGDENMHDYSVILEELLFIDDISEIVPDNIMDIALYKAQNEFANRARMDVKTQRDYVSKYRSAVSDQRLDDATYDLRADAYVKQQSDKIWA